MRPLLPPPSPDAGLLLLRVALGVILLFHGVFKLANGVAWIGEPLAAVGLPAFLAYGAYVAELVAPVLLIAGLWTRLAALVIAFDMLAAVALVLRPQLFAINPASGGWAVELEAMLLFAAVTVVLAGSGRHALRPDRQS